MGCVFGFNKGLPHRGPWDSVMQLSEIGLCENLHAVNDFNSLSQVIQESANINTFKRHVFIIIYYYYFNNFSLYILISFI